MKNSVLFISIMMFVSLFMCTRDFSVIPGENMDRELTLLEKELSTSSSEFGFEIFKEVFTAQLDSNIFISPLSISLALGMTFNGAEGETETAMRTTLGYGNLTDEQINKNYASLVHLLTNRDEHVQMDIANSIWIREGFPVQEDFIDVNKKYFYAEVDNLNFSSSEAVEIINNWVFQNTNGKIEKIVNKIDPLVVMYLINAIYFKAFWQYPFDPEQTSENWFIKQNGDSVLCPFMQQDGNFQYLETEQFRAVDLAYGQGNFSMSLLMPNSGYKISDIITGLDRNEWNTLVDQFSPVTMILKIPKFTLEYKINLNEVLKSLGMGIAFDEFRADFSDINPDYQLYISNVLHKSFIQVDEKGTEAAAVTSVEVSLTSVPMTVSFNRPFLFVIRERESNTVLFMGVLHEPEL
ncbi:MAG: serpin family protein [bacterium]